MEQLNAAKRGSDGKLIVVDNGVKAYSWTLEPRRSTNVNL